MTYDKELKTVEGIWLRVTNSGWSLGDPLVNKQISLRQARAWLAREDGRFDDNDGQWYETAPAESGGSPEWVALMSEMNLNPSMVCECFEATLPVEFFGGAKAAGFLEYQTRVTRANDDLYNHSHDLGGSRREKVAVVSEMHGVKAEDVG